MGFFEAYSFLLADSFMSALALPFKTNLVFPAMKIFGNYDSFLMVFLSTIGTLVGLSVDWFFGRFIMLASKYKAEAPRAVKFINYCKKSGKWLLLLSWVPVLGPVIVVVLGAVKLNLKAALPFIFIANVVYYSTLLLT